MDDLELLIDLHRDGARQGPGSATETQRAIDLSGLRDAPKLRIADLGCGTGAATQVLAQELDAHLIAVDLVEDFLRVLEANIRQLGLTERVSSLAASMAALPFEDSSLDAIWSEGAIYNVGFENGIELCHRFLKPDGILAVSELTWLTHARPDELDAHWLREYPEVGTASTKIEQLETHGYSPLGYFAVSEQSWLDNYYRPLQSRFDNFLARHGHNDAAQTVVAAEQAEIELYERYSSFVGYGYYIARKLGS